jgi:hypothetical protein
MRQNALYVIRKDRLAALKLDRDRAKTALDRIRAQRSGPTAFESQAIERFGQPHANQRAFLLSPRAAPGAADTGAATPEPPTIGASRNEPYNAAIARLCAVWTLSGAAS